LVVAKIREEQQAHKKAISVKTGGFLFLKINAKISNSFLPSY
jgi:hypothetical protein